MIRKNIENMKKLYTIGFVLIALFSIAMSVEALEYKTMYRQNGMSAYAYWMESAEGLTTDTFLTATKSDSGTDVYLSICTYDEVTYYWSCRSGYKLIQDDDFSIDKKLSSASLKPVSIYLYQWSCDEDSCWGGPESIATVEATWTGIGGVSKGSYKWMSKYGDYISKGGGSSSSRDGIAKGSIDGYDLETTNYAGLAKFKSAYMDMKK